MAKVRRPADDAYYVEPWTRLMQGDLFREVPFAFPWPTDTVLVGEGDRVYVSGPFDTTPAMLLTPTCTMAAQGVRSDPTTTQWRLVR